MSIKSTLALKKINFFKNKAVRNYIKFKNIFFTANFETFYIRYDSFKTKNYTLFETFFMKLSTLFKIYSQS